jgi:hypothetical protein
MLRVALRLPTSRIGWSRPTTQQDRSRARYCHYVAAEYGSITREGLPTDEHLGSRRLEELFVPLDVLPTRGDKDRAGTGERIPLAHALQRSRHLALLAAPGGGKSTLLKRLAVAYADPRRRGEADDELPDGPFLPLIIRCRQLGHLAGEPVRTILQDLPRRAEIPELAAAFDEMVTDALQRGEVLLLVDGLDEISDERDRLRFVHRDVSNRAGGHHVTRGRLPRRRGRPRFDLRPIHGRAARRRWHRSARKALARRRHRRGRRRQGARARGDDQCARPRAAARREPAAADHAAAGTAVGRDAAGKARGPLWAGDRRAAPDLERRGL